MFLGEDLLAWLVIALGGAMCAGNIAALVRPPKNRRDANDLTKAPILRSLIMATIGGNGFSPGKVGLELITTLSSVAPWLITGAVIAWAAHFALLRKYSRK